MKKNYFIRLLIVLLISIKLSACESDIGESSSRDVGKNIYHTTPKFYEYKKTRYSFR